MELSKNVKHLNVLNVEDDEIAREITKMFLMEFFDNVDVAKNGLEALEKFKKNSYNLVISDLNLPELNGKELVKEIKKINKNVPVLITTAYNDEEMTYELKKIGVNGFIVKPLDLEQFVRTLEKNL